MQDAADFESGQNLATEIEEGGLGTEGFVHTGASAGQAILCFALAISFVRGVVSWDRMY